MFVVVCDSLGLGTKGRGFHTEISYSTFHTEFSFSKGTSQALDEEQGSKRHLKEQELGELRNALSWPGSHQAVSHL